MTTKQETAIAKLDEALATYSIANVIDLQPAAKALAISKGLAEISKALDPLLEDFLHLAGSSQGFSMDKQYGKDVVKQVMVDALMQGLPLTGDLFMVFSERLYVQLKGYDYLVRTFPGVSNLVVQVGQPDEIKSVPKSKDVACFMPVTATWKMDGEDREFKASYYVRGYGGNSSFFDLLSGKAKRRCLRDVYATFVGQDLAPPDTDDQEQPEPKDVTPDEKPEADEKVQESDALAEDLLGKIELTTSISELEKVSEEIGEAKQAEELSPSALKKLGAAYTERLKELESESD